MALYSTKYPDSDIGGNSIRIRIASSPTNLHSFWDGLLGRGVSAGAIKKDVAEIEAVMKEKAETLKPDLQAHETPESWAREGAEIVRKAVYVDGELLKPREGSDGPAASIISTFANLAGRNICCRMGRLIWLSLVLATSVDATEVGLTVDDSNTQSAVRDKLRGNVDR